ncbi:MAG: SUMF1/EgtB/PvdO family nonheme iron enzyme, partial [Candidatus Latescibacteria bacterium]|nr:SUMF1/EgtB/PvdO family nonheme iron enzyme [Candidatus Latescibacterota bacterium]
MKRHIDLALLILLAHFFSLSCSGVSNGLKGLFHKTPSVGITFATIPGGTFQMGDEVGDLWDGCRPVHTVTVSGFEMGAYEITNAEYADYLNSALASGDVELKNGDAYGKS